MVSNLNAKWPKNYFLTEDEYGNFHCACPCGMVVVFDFRMLPTDIHKRLTFWFEGFTFRRSYEIPSCHESSEFSTSAVHTILKATLWVEFPEVLNCSVWCELAVHNLCSVSVVPENSLHPTLCTKAQMFYCHVLLRMWEKDQSNINNLFKNTCHEVSN